ncbi:aromatic acid/H+ symport family MFS transporter [Nocardiopsis sp. HNM0947]|uniref:Aromatic acid/H+ symport family MFS transporter n=1 Tax=Nocardiopsis coralli TaxID=2772213 RepID=A0ABR9NZW4_9ACTN|nr:aromatic acid/H+ symport family MFS transporter [Nocardiopsis coralli]MBE2997131.1 aromatic acid/H+ symport family MFS transporter [Nocardiopsis coralli]
MSSSAPARARRSSALVIALCFFTIVFDGYDLVIYGAITPALLEHEPWGLTPVMTGAIGSYALLGMFLGAVAIGYLTDVLGRRKILLGCVVFFSLMMAVAALAPNPAVFGLARFLAGLGLGGVIPTAIALTVEFSAPGKRNFNNALMFSGYAVGGVLSALLSLLLLEHIGFRGMLMLGALPLITVVPLLYLVLPESPAFLRARGRHEEAAEIAGAYGLDTPAPVAAGGEEDGAQPGRFRALLSSRYAVGTVLFCVAGIAGQTLVYGLNTWLPQLMVVAGYSTVSSLTFLLASNAGAVVGVLVSARLADRFGPRPLTLVAFATAAAALLLMGTGQFPQPAMYAFVAGLGFGSVGTQILINGYVATFFDDRVRATALGVTLGLGRIGAVIAISGGGVLLEAQFGTFVNFSVWSVAAAVGAVAILAVPRKGGVPAARQARPVNAR